jgi:hypothetical protein
VDRKGQKKKGSTQLPELIQAKPDADQPVGLPSPSLCMANSLPSPPLPFFFFSLRLGESPGESPRETVGLVNGCFFSAHRRRRAAPAAVVSIAHPINLQHHTRLTQAQFGSPRLLSPTLSHQISLPHTHTHIHNGRSSDDYAVVPFLCLRTCGGLRADLGAPVCRAFLLQ